MRNIIILAAVLLSLTYSATINIPADYSTIQAGINAANNGDLIRIADEEQYHQKKWCFLKSKIPPMKLISLFN